MTAPSWPPEHRTTLGLDDGRTAHVVFTDRRHGDLHSAQPSPDVDRRRAALVAEPWTVLHQVHGADVVVVGEPGQHVGAPADAAVTRASGAVLAVRTADCGPIALVGRSGAVGVVHAGWRGLRAGVVERAVDALRALAGDDVTALLGPCVHPCCYEFSAADLRSMVDVYGPTVEGRTADGRPALDVPAGVAVALERAGVGLDLSMCACTGCDDRWYSHRVRAESERQVVAAWISAP